MNMSLSHYGLLYSCIVLCCIFKSSDGEFIPNVLQYGNNLLQILSDNYKYYYDTQGSNQVDVKLYYECHCPDCIDFDTTQFKRAVQLLFEYLNIETYPYGNAQTIYANGTYSFICQHGEEECYGNMLHACALSLLGDKKTALLFNSCMMERTQQGRGSDDAAADRCGRFLNVDSTQIKICAKTEMGKELLEKYGEESKKANFNYVPYILVNGKSSDGTNFIRDICAAFADPPPPCAHFL